MMQSLHTSGSLKECKNTRPNEPYYISNELETSLWIKPSCGKFKSLVTCLNKLFHRLASILILLCNTYNKTKVSFIETLHCIFISLLNTLGKHNFFLDGKKRMLGSVLKK